MRDLNLDPSDVGKRGCKVPFPQNLLDEVLKYEKLDEYPEDFEASLMYALYTLSEKETKVTFLRWQKGKSQREISEIMNLSVERVRDWEQRAIRNLRHPSRFRYIKYGMKKLMEMEAENAVNNYKISHGLVDDKSSLLGLSIDKLEASTRLYNSLIYDNRVGRNGTIGDVIDIINDNAISGICGAGQSSIEELFSRLNAIGLKDYIRKDVWKKYVHCE